MKKYLKIVVALLLVGTVAWLVKSYLKAEKLNEISREERVVMETNSSVLADEDAFYGLKVEAEDLQIEVNFNGVALYSNYNNFPIDTWIPVNPYMISGENEIKVKMYGNTDSGDIVQLSRCKVELIMINETKQFKRTLSTLAFDNSLSDKFKGTTKAGMHRAYENMESPFLVKEAVLKNDIFFLGGHSGSSISQKITLNTPFPKWKFFESEDILDIPYHQIKNEDYEATKETPKLKKLYELREKILELVKKKDINSIVTLVAERNEEMDRAFNYEKGRTLKEFRFSLSYDMNDSNYELYIPKIKKPAYIVEDNNKIAYIEKALIFNKKDGHGSRTYEFKCRYEKDEWIITR